MTHAGVVAGALMLALAGGLAYAEVDAKTAADALYKDGVAAYRQQNYKQALTLFRTLEEKHPNCEHAVRGYEHIAQCENKLNDPYAAFEAYQAIWEKHKDFPNLPVITRNQMKIGNYLLASQSYKQAIEVYQKILVNAPYSDVAPAAQYSLAQAYIGENEYEAAKTELAKVIKNHPTSQLVDDAAYEIGRVCYVQSADAPYDQNATSDAIAAFRRFISDFPSSPKVADAQRCIRELRGRRAAALLRTAQFYENIQVPKAAELTYRELIEQYPDTAEADEGRARLAALGGTAVPKALPRSGASGRAPSATMVARPVDIAGTTRLKPQPAPMPVSEAQVDVAKREQVARLRALMQDPATSNALKREMKARYIEDVKHARLAQAMLAEARTGERTSVGGSRTSVRQPEPEQEVPPSTRLSVAAAAEPATSAEPSRRGTLADAGEPTRVAEPVRTVTAADAAEAAEPAQPAVATTTVGPARPLASASADSSRHAAQQGISTNLQPVEGLNMSDEAETALPSEPAAAGGGKVVARTGGGADATSAVTRLLKDVMVEEPEHGTGDDRADAAAAMERLKEHLATITGATEEVAAPASEAEATDAARAAEAKRSLDAARGTQETDDGTAAQIATDSRVRRAQYKDTAEPTAGSAYSNEDLKREYAPIYFLIQRGDEMMQRGLMSEAKREYGKALDRLLKLKQKAPTWQSDIINYRIDYCREHMKSVQ